MSPETLIETRRAAHAERERVAADRWSRFQAASRRRYAAKSPSLTLRRLLARAKAPGRVMLLAGSGVWEAQIETGLGALAGPAAALPAYVRAGPDPGVQPRALFDQSWYLAHARGLAGSRWAPLAHYLVVGDSHGFSPHPLVDAPAWRARHGVRMAARRFTALEDFLFEGAAGGENPHPLFDLRHYVGQSEAVAVSGENPLIHYLRTGWREGLEPHPLFAGAWYLEQNPDAAGAEIAPLMHYVLTGAVEGRDPHPLFDTAGYLKQIRGRLRAADPLSDFLAFGARELKSANPRFDPSGYLAQTGGSPQARANPLLHYLAVGAYQGLRPAPDFDEAAFFIAHPQAAASPLSALDYWLRNRSEGSNGPAATGPAMTASALYADLRRARAPDPEAYGNPAYAAVRRPRFAADTPADARVVAIRRSQPSDGLAVAHALPSYQGHQQPRIPADGLEQSLARDVGLARRYGLFGFCHEVADAAAAAMVSAGEFPFCLAWEGSSDPAPALSALGAALAAPAMIRIEGRPVLVLQPGADPAAWRAPAEPFGGLFIVQRGGSPAPGFDAHLPEPPPRPPDGPPGPIINSDFRGLVLDAAAVAAEQIARGVEDAEFPLAVAGRDTTPRSQDNPTVWHGACPGLLQAVLEAAADDLRGRPAERRLIFLQAWNDWESGAAIAPDLRFGHGWLEAVANAADADLLEG